MRAISHAYASEHAHLAYALTVQGLQGETVAAVVVARTSKQAIEELTDT